MIQKQPSLVVTPVPPPVPVAYKFSLNAEVSLTRNTFPLLLQAKNNTKTFSVSIREPKYIVIHCAPTNEIFYQFNLLNLRAIHNKFVSEGKMTIVIKEGVATKMFNSLAVSMDGVNTQDLLVQIMISKAVPSSLDLLQKKIKEIHTKALSMKDKKIQEKKIQQKKTQAKRNEEFKKIQQQTQKTRKLSRKQMQRQAIQQDMKIPPKPIKILKPPKPKPKSNLFDKCSLDILLTIFSYSNIHLQYRLLSKDCSKLVLSGLRKVYLKPDIPQDAFQNLTRYCLQVSCRMKNVKSLSHIVNNSMQGPLLQSNCKWYNFSGWKEMKNKHLNQLSGVRMYYLSLHYHSSISSASLKNLKMVWLSLTSRTLDRNIQIKDEDILQMINRNQQLTKLQIVRFNGNLLAQISNKSKLKLLQIQIMDIKKPFDWKVFDEMTSLETLKIGEVVTREPDGKLECTDAPFFPNNIITLSIGQYFDITRLNTLPSRIQNLTIVNQNVRNTHMYEMVLPNLRRLDISRCPLLSASGFDLYSNLDLIVQWDSFVVTSIDKQFTQRGIKIKNISK